MKIVDLSVTLDDQGISVVPGHPGFRLEAFFSHDPDFRCSTFLQMSTHTGTHVDAPLHFVKDGQPIAGMDLSATVGSAVLIDLCAVIRAGKGISVEQLKDCAGPREIRGKIAVLHTGWLREKWGTEEMYSGNPYLTQDAAEWLADQGVRSVALDFPMDNSVQGDLPKERMFPIHRVFLQRGIPHIENLCNLEHVDRDEFLLVALPIKLARGDGAPARVIAILD